MLNWVDDELFVNSNIGTILLNYNLKGFYLKKVNYIKINKQIDNIRQVYVNDILKPGLVNENNTVLSETKCNNCGCTKIIITGRGIIYSKNAFKNIKSDIVKSFKVFGDGHMCSRMIFISKNFYKVIKENSLDRDLVLEPIILV